MYKAILFARVSTVQQDLEPQLEAVKRAALYDGYQESELLIVQGKESAIKLKEEQRQTLTEMKQLVNDNSTIESIYFFAVDRLARRMSVVMSIKEWADDNTINLVFLNPQPMHTLKRENGVLVENEMTTLLLAMLSYGSAMEMKIKKARFATAKKAMKAQGKATGILTYGYTKDAQKNIVINKDEAKVVTWAYHCLINLDMSCQKIYLEGLELGYFPKKKNRLGGIKIVLNLLKNPTYMGCNPNGVIYPPIISKETYNMAVKILSNNIQKSKAICKNIYYCKGIIRNEETNYVMIAVRNNAVYRADKTDNVFSINANVVDTIIWREAIQAKWSLLSNQNTQNLQNYKRQVEELKVKIYNTENLVEDVKRRFTKAYDGMINNPKVTTEMYNAQVAVLSKEEKQYNNTINQYTIRLKELEQLISNAESKQARDINLGDVQAITDDNQRKEIINEVITDMRVCQINKDEFIIKVYNVINGNVPMEYYYKRSGCKKYLEMVLDDNTRLNISDEIEYRLKNLRAVRRQNKALTDTL